MPEIMHACINNNNNNNNNNNVFVVIYTVCD